MTDKTVSNPDDRIDYRENHTPRYWSHNPQKVALVGMGPSITDLMTERLTQEAAPDFADEVWVINMTSMLLWHDIVFWMDDLHDQEAFKPGLMAELRRHNRPVITAKSYPGIVPSSYDYPLDEIVRMSMEIFGKPYLNNSVAQAVAYAIYKGVKTLKLYGCDFTYPNREVAESGRACAEAWLTVANMRNMNLQVAPGTSIFDACDDKIVYGYQGPLSIDLGGGNQYEYLTPQEAERRSAPGYVPEDSSGKPPVIEQDSNHAELSGSLPGAHGARTHDAGRIDAAGQLDYPEAAPSPVGELGESLRDSDQPGGPEGPDSADHGGSRAAGDIPGAGNGPGRAQNGAKRPRRKRAGTNAAADSAAVAGEG